MTTLRAKIASQNMTNSEPGRVRIMMVTHVVPYPPAAGNEIRIFKLLSRFRNKGYFVSLVIRPLEDIEISNECILGLSGVVDDLHIYDSRVKPGNGQVGDQEALDEDYIDKALQEMQDAFCPIWFARDIAQIINMHRPHAIIAQYIFMSRILNLEEAQSSLKIIDSHDLFCRKKSTAEQYGIKDYGLSMTETQEASLLQRADVVLAIQEVEQEQIAKLVPKKRVVLTSFDLELSCMDDDRVVDGSVLIVASGNEFNVQGTQDFIDYTWPLLRENNPAARLRIVGRVCRHVQTDDPTIDLVGFVENLDHEYQMAEVVVNPCRVGTGLKIKTIEALSRGKAHVAWPSAIDGLGDPGKVPVRIVTDAVEFADAIIELLGDREMRKALSVSAIEFIRANFQAERVYHDLDMEIELAYKQKS